MTNDREYQTAPAFSPDGTKITYASGVWPNTHIWVMNVDGNNKIQLTSSGLESSPSWSPDSRFIAYQKSDCRDSCPWNIWVMKSDGTEQTQLTNWAVDGKDGGTPKWHPNGKKILFVSNGFATGNLDWDIYEMILGGTYIQAKVDIDPDTLNLMSNGKWITAYMELPVGYDVSKIDTSTVKLLTPSGNEVQADTSAPATVGDYNSNGISDLMVKFNRATLAGYLSGTGTNSEVALKVTGKLLDGTQFEGTDTIRVIKKGK